MDERQDGHADDHAAERPPSIVDRVRATLGDAPSDEDAPFDRSKLSAWLGEEPERPPPASGAGLPTTPEAAVPPPEEPRANAPSLLADRRLLLVSAIAGVLALALIGAVALAIVNARRADDWQQRAEQVQIRTKIINDLLVERSHDVNAHTRALNATAAKLRSTRRALARSEADVRALVRRQSELANEKAQAEDGRLGP